MKAEYEGTARLIREAFAGVTLGGGIGLWQGQALDDYADDATIALHRSRDEKNDWSRLTVDNLNHCYSSLFFFDADGMRFHLPAFLLAELEGTLRNGILFTLTDLNSYGRSQFTTLNRCQRAAVRQFLLLFKDDPDFSLERRQIVRALNEYWTEVAQPESRAVFKKGRRRRS
ncbi:MAG: hypothetical protein IH624_04275 [Phycisphaerae bacterium]|nr:hypothetical protein [Phycisphaerae bacterium]